MSEPTDHRGQVALITGGGTGIGRATALAFAHRGMHVAVNYSRSNDDADHQCHGIFQIEYGTGRRVRHALVFHAVGIVHIGA